MGSTRVSSNLTAVEHLRARVVNYFIITYAGLVGAAAQGACLKSCYLRMRGFESHFRQHTRYIFVLYAVTHTWHDWRSWQRVGLIILRSWVRSPHCAGHVSCVSRVTRSIGAVGSALVLCTEGPGFEPLMEQSHYVAGSHPADMGSIPICDARVKNKIFYFI